MSKVHKGQTLVIVFFLMLLALSIGIVISQRFVNNFRMDVRIDDYSKATGVTDALVEKLLGVPYTQLIDYVNNNNCGSDCSLTITYPEGNATATGLLSRASSITGSYTLSAEVDDTVEIDLATYAGSNLTICWNNQASVYAALVYTSSGVVNIQPYAYNATGNLLDNGFSTALAQSGYGSCFTINMTGTVNLLRLKPYYQNTSFIIIPQAGVSLPSQGVTINVTGRFNEAVKNTIVVKTTPSAPTIFDNIITQTSPDHPLSNKIN
jgi:hypothetical protein